MRFLLLGYFGQNNFGDEAINRSVTKLIVEEFGEDIDINLCNQANYTINYKGKFEESCKNILKKQVSNVWFDTLQSEKYDMLIILNSGFGYSFCIDIALQAIDKGIPIRIYSFKQKKPNGMLGDIYSYIFKYSQFTIIRDDFCYKSFNLNDNHIINGLDISYFNENFSTENLNYITIVPRYYNDKNSFLQIDAINYLIKKYSDLNFKIFNCSKDDLLISNKLFKNNNLDILDLSTTNIERQLKEIQKSSHIISLGRYHPLFFSLKYNIPSIYLNLNINIDQDKYDMYKINNLCNEFGIREVRDYKKLEISQINNNFNTVIFNNKVNNMYNILNIER